METAMRILIPALLTLLVGVTWAEDPQLTSKPPFQRLLRGEDEKTVMTLAQKMKVLLDADDYEGAAKVAEELAALRTRVQGAYH
jgi:hypothetical protein